MVVYFVSLGISPYYLIMLFPLFALAAGGAMEYLTKMGTSGALATYALLYGPLVMSYIGSTTLPFIRVNYPLFFLKYALFAAPPPGGCCL